MKKRLIALILVVVSMLALFACSGGAVKAKVDYSTETETIITVTKAEEKATLIDAMKELKKDEKLAYESTSSQYGEMVNTIGTRTADADAFEFWAIYTTDLEFANDEVSVTVNGQTFYQAMLGASSLTVKDGESYLWRLETWA